jgi:hypothetical protein
MNAFLAAAVLSLAAATFIAFGVLVEMFDQLKQVRKYLELVDTPTTLDLADRAGKLPSSVALPSRLDQVHRAVVLFLSNKCETCHTIAESLAGIELPNGLWVVLVPVTSGKFDDFLKRYPLRGDRLLIDDGQVIAARIGLDITPAAVIVEDGRMVRAQTVPTVRQLYVALRAEPKRILVPRQPGSPGVNVVSVRPSEGLAKET